MIRTAIAAIAANADADQVLARLGMAEGGIDGTVRHCVSLACLDHCKAGRQNETHTAPGEN
jgi:hypothetical protein